MGERLLSLILWPFTWLNHPLGLLAYVTIAFAVWYVFYSVECELNSGSLGRNPYTMAFLLFWEQLLWSIPGGLKRRADYVKENLVQDWKLGGVFGTKRFWNYAEVREKNLYVECARDVLPTPFYFWFMVVGSPLVWPVTLTLAVALILLGWALSPFEPLFDKMMDKYETWKEHRNQKNTNA